MLLLKLYSFFSWAVNLLLFLLLCVSDNWVNPNKSIINVLDHAFVFLLLFLFKFYASFFISMFLIDSGSMVYIQHPRQKPRKPSSAAQMSSVPSTTMAATTFPKNNSIVAVRVNRKPMRAAKIFGPSSTMFGFIFSVLFIFLAITTKMLFFGFRNALMAKSIVKSAVMIVAIRLAPSVCATIISVLIKKTIVAVVLMVLLSLFCPVMGQLRFMFMVLLLCLFCFLVFLCV